MDFSAEFQPQSPPYKLTEQQVGEDLGAAFQLDLFSDAQFQVHEDETLAVHKVILAARCPYFYSLFLSGMMETKSDVFFEKETPLEVFSIFVYFLYRGEVELAGLSTDDALALLIVADRYGTPELVDRCETLLAAHVENGFHVSDMIQIAELYHATQLHTYCVDFIRRKYDTLFM